MITDPIKQRLATRKRTTDQLATDLIMDCERAASGRNSGASTRRNGMERIGGAISTPPPILRPPCIFPRSTPRPERSRRGAFTADGGDSDVRT
ncbi:hypothetical protein SAMN06265338_1317 [Rhodoblastus acidophilus]|uniref:Uncharacterized protein n=1 Tax=Rhodoblastus acidophilus TaxID=1074 RepID=A0A212SE42_RHOAC|nr:hypothetical protein CKO16_21310 [Rhodoblastus acidophilus]RAI20014.1 hypothetical protein CH337_11010 [Rhodoblastus acidophilus]SNB83879.1 hypothetical protein SAMN06265338_1317 [Rhodoblastus acidophilus]